jgi:hypothetical protein
MPSSCLECRYGSLKHNKISDGKDSKGYPKFQIITKYFCAYDSIVHAVDQIDCPSYLGHLTLFEYLTQTQPQELYDLLSNFNLRVKDSRNKYGFDIVEA